MNPPSQHVYCLVRKTWVKAFPEEIVRQRILKVMVEKRGFPLGCVAVERGLDQMPHIDLHLKIPQRRADILCFGKGIHPRFDLYPLLLIECKAVKLTAKVISQVVGYNHYIQAYFLAIANSCEVQTGWYDKTRQAYAFIQGLPSYDELLSSIKRKKE